MDWTFIKKEYGNIASTIGLFVSIVGFIVTVYKVRKVRKAAEKAQEIVRETLSRVGHQLISTQINTAVRIGQEIGNSCRSQQWNRAIDRCEQLRILLANQVEDSRLKDSEYHFIKAAIDDLSLIMQELEKIERQEGTLELPPREMESLNKIVIHLSRIDGRLRNKMLEA